MSRALGRYELLRPLARGGMAEVFLARRRAAGVEKWLVVKRMRRERAGDARFLELFVREAKLSMSLAHQNIVPVFDFGRIDDQVFIAMERVEGKDLGSSLGKATAPLPPLLAAFVAAECCQALDYAHLRKGPDGTPLGIVHRDVTPRNVMLSWSGEVKLTDFGIAALAGDAASIAGTPAYMAPEQARGEPIDLRADVYALGMVLREALTGVRPRPSGEREATLAAARAGELVPWPEGFASPLQAIVDRATALDRDTRYADARAMLEELDAFMVGERAANKTDAPARRLAAWLAATWQGEREDAVIDGAFEGSQLLSFLDDGGLDAMGTGTERSMAATAAELEAPADTMATPAEGLVTPKPTPAPAPAPTPAPAPAAVAVAASSAAARPRWIVPVAALVGLGVAAFAIAKITRSPAAPIASVPPTPVEVGSAHVVTPPPIDAAEVTPPPAIDATALVVPPIDATIAQPKHPHRDAQVTEVKPPQVLHAVKVNAKPWAYFTVDDNPTQYQTLETIHVAAGAHVIHFTHDQLHRDVSIQVPDSDALIISEDMTH